MRRLGITKNPCHIRISYLPTIGGKYFQANVRKELNLLLEVVPLVIQSRESRYWGSFFISSNTPKVIFLLVGFVNRNGFDYFKKQRNAGSFADGKIKLRKMNNVHFQVTTMSEHFMVEFSLIMRSRKKK